MKERIVPVGLKGYEISDRMKELMGMQPINENKKTSVVELTKRGPDGNVYGIVRENHEYYIKVTTKQDNLVAEDFSYIGGLQNKKSEVYPSYAKATKHLNLKFNSLNEAYGSTEHINVFQSDNLMNESGIAVGFQSPSGPMFKNEGNLAGNPKSTCCQAPIIDGKCSDCGATEAATPLKEEDEDPTLSEVEQAIEDMREGDDIEDTSAKIPVKENHKLSIGRAVNDMDSIIEGVVESDKKKVYTIL